MLTKKQLKDAARCCGGLCELCSNKTRMAYQDCIREAAKTALTYRELAEKRGDMLKRLEWSGQKGNYIADECPVCRNARYQGHKPDCEIAALLKESEVEEG
jgi:hypothetical protein